jgi:hypothetical protein
MDVPKTLCQHGYEKKKRKSNNAIEDLEEEPTDRGIVIETEGDLEKALGLAEEITPMDVPKTLSEHGEEKKKKEIKYK